MKIKTTWNLGHAPPPLTSSDKFYQNSEIIQINVICAPMISLENDLTIDRVFKTYNYIEDGNFEFNLDISCSHIYNNNDLTSECCNLNLKYTVEDSIGNAISTSAVTLVYDEIKQKWILDKLDRSTIETVDYYIKIEEQEVGGQIRHGKPAHPTNVMIPLRSNKITWIADQRCKSRYLKITENSSNIYQQEVPHSNYGRPTQYILPQFSANFEECKI